MKARFLLILCISFFSFFSSVSALIPSSAPKLIEAKDTSLSISWDKVPGALGYFISYGKTPGSSLGYSDQLPEYVEGTSVVIPKLTPNTKYYVAITVVDDKGEEGDFSPESMFTTLPPAENPELAFTEVKILDTKKVSFGFNIDLDDTVSAPKEFKVTERGTGDEIPVEKIVFLDAKTLMILFTQDLKTNTTYSINTVSLMSKTGKTIESGAAGEVSFTTRGDFSATNLNVDVLDIPGMGKPTNTPNDTSENPLPVAKDPIVTPTMGQEDYSGNVGKAITKVDIEKTTVNAVDASKKLPQTGPEALLLLFIALLCGFGVFYFQARSRS